MKKKIVLIDSGVGGLFILKECEKIISGYEFIYIADSFNAPYGNKKKSSLKKIAESVVWEAIKKFDPEMVIIACNTLTVNAISFLRQRFKGVKIVGVEPAIKKAKIYGGDTIVLSTPATQKNFKFLERKINKKLKAEYKKEGLEYQSQDKVFWVADESLATLIEQNFENIENIKPHLENILLKEKYGDAENLVLGCTHYLAVKKNIQEIFQDINIFDGSVAVATRAKSLLAFKNKPLKNKTKIKFLSTSGNKKYEENLKKYYNLIKNN